MLTNIIIALFVVLAAIVFYWQKDKTSFLAAARSYWLLYVVVFAVTAFLTGWLLDSEFGRRVFQIAVGGSIVFYWAFLSGLFKKKV
jgi:cytochrome bd-type quinol oxidase subunit 1